MNVYDFDKTIYVIDSTQGFYRYALRRHPLLIRYIFKQGFSMFLFVIGKRSLGKAKEGFMSFLKGVDDPQKLIEEYWDQHMDGIKTWYLNQHRDDDVVISASPEPIVREACRRIGISNVIATGMDLKTCKFTTENAKAAEKPKRFRKVFPDAEVEKFYSDSLTDTPMAKLAKESFLVKGDKISPWPM